MEKRVMATTEQAIAALIAASGIDGKDLRTRHLFRESLRNLVRLAKAEHLLEMRADVRRAIVPIEGVASSAFIGRQ